MKRQKVMQQQGENTPSPVVTVSDNTTSHHITALVFDSGVGGLSVYDEIRQLLPDLNIIYAFDNAFFPYGEKSANTIIERVVNISQAIARLHQIDIIIIACNTASTVALPALRTSFTQPIVGVVPAIKPAVALTHNRIVGLLATKATVERAYTHDLINQFAGDCEIKLLGSSKLVQIAEDKLHGQPVNLMELKQELMPWLSLPQIPDTIILGCTHFPLIKTELAEILPVGTQLIDSGAAIAKRVASLLKADSVSLLSDSNSLIDNQANNRHIAYCTSLNSDAALLGAVLTQYDFTNLYQLAL